MAKMGEQKICRKLQRYFSFHIRDAVQLTLGAPCNTNPLMLRWTFNATEAVSFKAHWQHLQGFKSLILLLKL